MDPDEIDDLILYNLSYDVPIVETLTMIDRLDLLEDCLVVFDDYVLTK